MIDSIVKIIVGIILVMVSLFTDSNTDTQLQLTGSQDVNQILQQFEPIVGDNSEKFNSTIVYNQEDLYSYDNKAWSSLKCEYFKP